MTTKKKYEKPVMQVYKLRENPQLLQMSNLDPYNPGGNPLNP